ncbi:MAG TPA: 23S rRNA (uracil(1939)-C(5))-methyltransferase RlmD [Thermoleophilia bacterium]|nr:23S rRNA (uracil(1939)-C(5))-methyltransferase RlmD [Thermoleophilia bacterium]
MALVAKNEELVLDVESLAYGGRGVARHGQLVVFVPRALPGDRIRARVTRVKRSYAEARVVELMEAGPGRVEPRCAHFGICGGCAWQDLDYAEQLRHKHDQVADALRRLGGLDGFELRPIEPAVETYGYRNKVEYSWLATPDGPALGFHRAGRWDSLLAVETCHITSAGSNDVRRAFVRWAGEAGLEAWDQRTGSGFLRHLVVREGVRTGEFLAQLVTAPGRIGPGSTRRLTELLPPAVAGVVRSTNSGVAEVTGGLEVRSWIGADRICEQIGGLTFEVTAGAFMQTNTAMAERLYALAIGAADLTGAEVVWDLYCGGGAIGLLAAGASRHVYGIELSTESIARARDNAARNRIERIEFVVGDVARSVRPLLERAESPDVVFVDPPRAGLTPRAVRRVLELAPQRIVYVSCNPTTLAPNARQLVDGGYLLDWVQPVDMFPHTPHIECVARFTRDPDAVPVEAG